MLLSFQRASERKRLQVMSSRNFMTPVFVSMAMLLAGCGDENKEATGADSAAGGATSDGSSGELLELQSFCRENFGGSLVKEQMVANCSCCAAFGNTNYADQVELLYGSQKVKAPARNADGRIAGWVPTMSLGDYVPEMVCKMGGNGFYSPHCVCAAQDKTWMEYEPSCGVGAACTRSEDPVEWPTVCAEGQMWGPCGKRDSALGRDGTDPAKGALSDSQQRIQFDSHNDMSLENLGRQECDAPVPLEKQPSGMKIDRRVSLGSTGRCEDMAASQCHLFFAKTRSGWSHCEESTSNVKQCPASISTEEEAIAEAKRMQAWAVKNAFVPDAWPVTIQEDGTWEATTMPSREEFMQQIGNLPRKMEKSYVA